MPWIAAARKPKEPGEWLELCLDFSEPITEQLVELVDGNLPEDVARLGP